MAEGDVGRNLTFPINNADGTSFNGLSLKKATYNTVVMSLGDNITGDVFYQNNALVVTMEEYIEYNGVRYVLVNPPTIVREGMVSNNSELKGMTKYSFTFYHPMYMLGNFPFTDVAVSSDEEKYLSEKKTFSWIGNLNDYVAKLNKNLYGTEWVCEVGATVPNSVATKLSGVMSFDKNTIAEALKNGYDTWKVPYIIDKLKSTDSRYSGGKRFLIHFGLPSEDILNQNGDVFVFRCGQGVGLKNNSRTPRNNKIITRIAGYGSSENVPYGYPQIIWLGNQSWNYTVNNDPSAANSYPIYDGIVGGQNVRLIHHPFTRSCLMPTVYVNTVDKKVNPYASGYNPHVVIKDYYDAVNDGTWEYTNQIVLTSPSYEIHEFEDIKPELGSKSIINASAVDFDDEKKTLSINDAVSKISSYINQTNIDVERHVLQTIIEKINNGQNASQRVEQPQYFFEYNVETNNTFTYVSMVSSNINFEMTIQRESSLPSVPWNDKMDDDGNYVQSYFSIKLPTLDFDLYACASVTQEMKINMRSGACIGCTFDVEVDWEDYKKNFYDTDGKFAPNGAQRDFVKYPNSSEGQITVIVKKDLETFGTLMPNIYQKPTSGDKFVILGISLPQSYIDNAQQRLDNEMRQYMLDNNVYYYDYPLKFDEYFLANNTDILSQIRPNVKVLFVFANEQHVLYIKQLTIKYGQGVLPQYEITLTDDVEIVLNAIGQVAEEVSNLKILLGEEGNGVVRDKYLSRLHQDTAKGLIKFSKGLTTGNFKTAVDESGAFIDKEGNAEFQEIVARGNLSSPDFVSGFPNGNGWAIQKKAYINAAGAIENKYVLECDAANIRGTLRIYEFIISQLLGENDNRIFTAMQEVYAYDSTTGKVWLKTNGGKLYNPFRVDDCIMVQQYQPGNTTGYIVKQYELIITAVGTGGMTDDNGDRLDWVQFTNFTTSMEGETAETLITENDTFCRLDNLTDTERKGIIQMVSVGTGAPYMDIVYALKTDPDDSTKGRIGNLEGIRHHLFGWLEGFGIYTSNAYLVGDLRLRRSGESVDTNFEILRDRLAFKMAETVYEVTGADNYLANAEFTELDEDGKYRDWTISGNGMRFFTTDGSAIVSSVGTLGNVQSCARTELVEGKQVMHIVNASLTQSKNVITQPQKHKIFDEGDGTTYVNTYTQVWDTLYLSLRIRVLQNGTLTIGFPNSRMSEADAIKSKVQVLESSEDWQILTWDGVWDGNSDFYLQFTGECYITLLALTDNPLDSFKQEYSTQITQTTRNITLSASKIQQNAEQIASITLDYESIALRVTDAENDIIDANTNIATNTEKISSLEIRADNITASVTTIRTDVDSLSGTVLSHTTSISTLQAEDSRIWASVNSLTGDVEDIDRDVSLLTQTSSLIEQSVAALNTKKVAPNNIDDWSTTSGNMIVLGYRIKVTKYTLFYLKSGYMLYVDFYNSAGTLVSSKSGNGSGKDTPMSISVPSTADTARIRLYYSRRALQPSDIGSCEFMYTEDNIITQSNLSLYVEDNISWLSGDANNIKFTFDKTFKIYSRDSNNTLHEVLNLTPSGDLGIAGKFHGEFDDTVSFGTGTKKMYIEPTSTGARLIGKDGTKQVLSLGFSTNSQGSYVPSLFLQTPNGSQDSLVRIQSGTDWAEVLAESAGTTGRYHIVRLISDPGYGFATVESNRWPTSSSTSGLSTGSVYVDNNGFLKAKGY